MFSQVPSFPVPSLLSWDVLIYSLTQGFGVGWFIITTENISEHQESYTESIKQLGMKNVWTWNWVFSRCCEGVKLLPVPSFSLKLPMYTRTLCVYYFNRWTIMEKAAVLSPFKFSKCKRSVLTACKTIIALNRYLNHLRISLSFCLNCCQTRIKLQIFGQCSRTKLFVE